MKRILWKPMALRQLRKIREKEARETIYDAVDSLNRFPDCPNIKKLRDREEYRLRVKQWRVIFLVSSNVITVEEIKKRDEHTY